ncbi:hypothetical protein [Mariniblastus fucicola]|uniref:PEP-CTERM protein-sorting domain-containing protein n=1 Tax=Mariniblastus fucicola TaxID=980251 RepID=A0A5B9PFW9_9BACT|nr:hypothetical protein [Mariniblastus fucicola]QEG24095.1 hypothetical protein MFFC18_40110 [Mariniblastus fucicola]
MIIRFLATVSILLAISSSVHADIVIFTDQSAWLAATQSLITENFDDTTLVSGLSSTSDNGGIAGGTWNDTVTDPLIGSASTTEWSYTNAPTAWGAFFDLTPGGEGSGIDIDVQLDDLSSESLGTIDSDGFWGFISDDQGINSIEFSTSTFLGLSQEEYAMDNMSTGFAAVPEPSAATVLVLASMALLRRRR